MPDCVAVPLGGPLAAALRRLWAELEDRWPVGRSHPEAVPHLTLAVVTGPPARLAEAVAATARQSGPLTVTGAGYGLFTGHDRDDLVLHVALTTTPELAALHERLLGRLDAAELTVDPQTRPRFWRPHLNLADRGLTPGSVGEIMAYLVESGPRHWTVPVEELGVLRERGPWDCRAALRPGATCPGRAGG